MPDFDFRTLRRFPDAEADNLFAWDASDRLLLDLAADDLANSPDGSVVVIGDRHGALTIGAASLGVRGMRVFQDRLAGETALTVNAGTETLDSGMDIDFRSLGLDRELVSAARVVLMQLPGSLGELDELAALVSAHASPEVVVYAAGRVKHMRLEMNAMLARHFSTVEPSLARQKSRVIVARGPHPPLGARLEYPRREFHEEYGLWLCAHGGVFAGTKVDIGTRFLLTVLDQAVPDAASAIDLGCGTGVLAATLARSRPGLAVTATDQSWLAVASARATMEANGLADRVTVVRDLGLDGCADESADLIVLNPPFHIGTSIDTEQAEGLFRDAGRVLTGGGELWTVFNSSLGYRPMINRFVGETREIARNSKFMVVASVRSRAVNLSAARSS